MSNPIVERQLKTPLHKRFARFVSRKFSSQYRREIAEAEEQIYANRLEQERAERQMRVLSTSVAREDAGFYQNRAFVAEQFGIDSTKISRYLMVMSEKKLSYHSPLTSYVLSMNPERVQLLFSRRCGQEADGLLARMFMELNKRASCYVEYGIDAVDQQVASESLVEREVPVTESRSGDLGFELNMPKYIRGGDKNVPVIDVEPFEVTSTKIIETVKPREIDSSDIAILLALGSDIGTDKAAQPSTDKVVNLNTTSTVDVRRSKLQVEEKPSSAPFGGRMDIPDFAGAGAKTGAKAEKVRKRTKKSKQQMKKWMDQVVINPNSSPSPGGLDITSRGFS
ncbi:hypothetical protein F7U66_01815 [Vibrio parahaemolyticus]|nr:hypothetical protein [Vibrio parahaemolyticus]